MFGRRRRRLAASAALVIAPAPILHDEQIFEILHAKMAALLGENGAWTLVPRSTGDTEVIFHGLKARQIAVELTEQILAEQAVLRGETSGEPTALAWTPEPITTWSEPTTQPASVAPVLAATPPTHTTDAELAEASAAWINRASATLASARLVTQSTKIP